MQEQKSIFPIRKALFGIGPPRILAWAMLFVFCATLSISKALLSISIGGLFLAALWQLAIQKDFRLHRNPTLIFLLMGIFGLALLAGLWTDDTGRWIRDLREKLPFLLIPLSLAWLPRFNETQRNSFILIFILSQSLVAVISLLIYFQDYEQALYNISINKSVEVIGSISHIYFGLFLSLSCFLAFDLFLKKRNSWPRLASYGLLAFGLLDGICLHLFTSRTGLVGFYGTLGICLLWWIVRQKQWLKGALLLGALLLLPVLAYQTLPSFKQRVGVTLWDLRESKNVNRDLSQLSVGTRFATWQTSWEVFAAHPLIGVGKGDLGAEMDQQYETNGIARRTTYLSHEPHNQYLNTAATTGILGLLLLGMLFWWYILSFRKKQQPIFLLFVCLVLIGMFFESILERQVGMTFFVFFSLLLFPSSE